MSGFYWRKKTKTRYWKANSLDHTHIVRLNLEANYLHCLLSSFYSESSYILCCSAELNYEFQSIFYHKTFLVIEPQPELVLKLFLNFGKFEPRRSKNVVLRKQKAYIIFVYWFTTKPNLMYSKSNKSSKTVPEMKQLNWVRGTKTTKKESENNITFCDWTKR